MNHNQITKAFKEVGACWAIRSDKFCDPNDPYEDRIAGKKTYHIHPDCSEPCQNRINRFSSLKDIEEWINTAKQVAAAWDGTEKGMMAGNRIWNEYHNRA